MTTHNNLSAVLDGLAYDFPTFELTHFIRHVENHRRREILVSPLPFKPELSAAWIRAKTADYIFYNACIHQVQQTHSILHEMAHIILEHPCQPLDQVLLPEFLSQLTGRLRLAADQLQATPEEQEAEAFVLLIQQRLVAARRLAELMGPSSSIGALRRWVDGMVFTG